MKDRSMKLLIRKNIATYIWDSSRKTKLVVQSDLHNGLTLNLKKKKLDDIERTVIAHKGLFIGAKYILDQYGIEFAQSKVG